MKKRYKMTPPEERTAQALTELGYRYKYERPLFLHYRTGLESVRYPDFYIPGLDLYIEVRSLDRGYDIRNSRVRKKNRLYKENALNWIEIDPAYRDRQGKRRMKSLQAIERTLKKKISEYLERRKKRLLMPCSDGDFFGEFDRLEGYGSKPRRSPYSGGLAGSYGFSGPGSRGYRGTGAGRYR